MLDFISDNDSAPANSPYYRMVPKGIRGFLNDKQHDVIATSYKALGIDLDRQRPDVQRYLMHYGLAGLPLRAAATMYHEDGQNGDFIRNYADTMVEVGLRDGFAFDLPGLTLLGENKGTGKTTAAIHVARAAVLAFGGSKVQYVTFKQVLDWKDAELYEKCSRVPVLVIDELRLPRTEAQGHLYEDRFSGIINDRYDTGLLTMLTGNISVDDLDKHYPRAADRLAETNEVVSFTGPSLRRNQEFEQTPLSSIARPVEQIEGL